MKVYISQFYNIRHLQPNQVPVSTAVWDPKWFHDNHNKNWIFQDKRGVWNGIRLEALMPGKECENLCDGSCYPKEPDTCVFLQRYKEQLAKVDFNYIMDRLQHVAEFVSKTSDIKDPIEIVLMVYEKPDTQCSERWEIKNLFERNGVFVEDLDFPSKQSELPAPKKYKLKGNLLEMF